MRLVTLLAMSLAGCTSQAIIPLSIVTDDIVQCKDKKLSKVPKRDLSEAEVEKMWKYDRFVAKQKGDCLERVIAGDQVQSGKK